MIEVLGKDSKNNGKAVLLVSSKEKIEYIAF